MLKKVDVFSKTKPLTGRWKCSKTRAQWRGRSDGGGLQQKDFSPLIIFSKTHPNTHNSDTYSHKEKKKKKKDQRYTRTRSVRVLMTIVKYVQSGRTFASSWKKSEDMIKD